MNSTMNLVQNAGILKISVVKPYLKGEKCYNSGGASSRTKSICY